MDYQTYLNSLKFGNVSDAINTFKNNVSSQFELPLDMKSLDLQTTINNLTDAKSNEDAKDGIIASALSGLGMSGENLALLKKFYMTAKEKLGIGDFKIGDKIDELKDLAKGKLEDVVDGLKGKAQDLIDNVKSNVQDTVEGIQQNIKDGVNQFTGGGNTESEIEMTQPSSWKPVEMQDLSERPPEPEIEGLDDTDYMSKPPVFQNTTSDEPATTGTETGAETAETGAETAETGAETGLEEGAETALETGAEAAAEGIGGILDGTGVLAPIGVALQLAGLGASIYQAVSDASDTATITSDENAQNALKQQVDTFKETLQSRTYAGSNVLGSLSSVGGLNSVTSSFF